MLTNESFQKGRLKDIIPETVATVTKRLNKSGMYGESTFTTLWVFLSLGVGCGYTILLYMCLIWTVEILSTIEANAEEAKPVLARKNKEAE